MKKFVQKNYGLISGIREKAADRILGSAVKNLEDFLEESKKIRSQEHVKNPEASKILYQNAEDKLGIGISHELTPGMTGRVIRNLKPGDPGLAPLDTRIGLKGKERIKTRGLNGETIILEKDDISRIVENAEKIKSGVNSGKYKHLVLLGPNSGDEIFAHEAGHVGNDVEGGLITRYISRNHKTGKKYHNRFRNVPDYISSPSLSLKDLVKNGVGSRMLVREEKNASRRGIRYMKEAGYSPQEIQKARENMRTAYNTYNLKSKALIKTDFYKKIQTQKRLENKEKIKEDLRKYRTK